MEAIVNRLLDEMKQLNAQVVDGALNKPKLDSYESSQINEICTALAKAQGEFPRIEHNRDNSFFKSSYADLHAIVSVIRPVLSKNGLSVTQITKISSTGEIVLHTKLIHASGQWIETRSRIIPEKGDVQSYGRAVSYHKRYALMGLLSITASGDSSDDDAEGLMEKHRELTSKAALNYDPKKQSPTTITQEQLEELELELDGYPDLAQALKNAIKIEQLCDMPKSMYHDTLKKVRERKVAYTKK